LIELHHLPPELRPAGLTPAQTQPLAMKVMQKHLITEALRRHQGNRRRAARELGLDPSTLYRKIRALGIEPPVTDGRHRRR
jgi:transcriptional regulator of acetoin/glycerol metabolism